ncbi:MAG: hypothetical protein WDN49_03875 [Acetobacteraceae bacterium]
MDTLCETIVLVALVLAGAALGTPRVHAAEGNLAARCAQLRNDDTLRGYDPALRPGLLKAFARLFPDAPQPPATQVLQTGASVRCMDGRLLACFVGANLPCGKMNAARDNPGADAFLPRQPSGRIRASLRDRPRHDLRLSLPFRPGRNHRYHLRPRPPRLCGQALGAPRLTACFCPLHWTFRLRNGSNAAGSAPDNGSKRSNICALSQNYSQPDPELTPPGPMGAL